jgi:hypothetical protein
LGTIHRPKVGNFFTGVNIKLFDFNKIQKYKEKPSMATTFFNNNGIVSFDSISSEEDLKLSPWININPPPSDGKCQCCGRHISEVKPFGKAGDPLVGDFEGALLIKKFRPDGPYDEESEKAWDKAEKHLTDAGCEGKDPLEWLIKNYGEEKGEYFYWSFQLHCSISKSWECRDCAVLDTDEYFEILFKNKYKEI